MHRKAKLVKGQKTLTFSATEKGPPTNGNGEILDSNCSVVQLEERASSANTLNIQSISKSETSVKSSILIASSSETSCADENGRKLDMISREISKLNSKFSEKIKPCKQASELPK